jgi:surface protein
VENDQTTMASASSSSEEPLPVEEWRSRPPEESIFEILSHFDVITLIAKKQVCPPWTRLCTLAIDAKRTCAFRTNKTLLDAVQKYLHDDCDNHTADTVKEFATTYGYPIGKWDVSNVKDFSSVFALCGRFNEDISMWDVSNATTMNSMFRQASSFHQDFSDGILER